jgi:hypothetical protein
MNEDEPIDLALKDRFRALRGQESASVPSFRAMTESLPESSSSRRNFSTIRTLASAAVIGLVAIPLLVMREPVSPSLNSSLPILLGSDSEKTSLFAELEKNGPARRYLSDDLLPFHVNLNL